MSSQDVSLTNSSHLRQVASNLIGAALSNALRLTTTLANRAPQLIDRVSDVVVQSAENVVEGIAYNSMSTTDKTLYMLNRAVHPTIRQLLYYFFNIGLIVPILYALKQLFQPLLVHLYLTCRATGYDLVSKLLRTCKVIGDKRTAFRKLAIPEVKEQSAHSHGNQQAVRHSARQFALQLATKTGSELYYIQPAKSEACFPGVSRVHWPSDLDSKTKDSEYREGMIEYYCDSDYYDDYFEHDLATKPRPRLLFTFAPTRVATSSEHGTYYTFTENSEVDVHVPGGAQYKHKLWDYGTDRILAKYFNQAVVYTVERRTISDTHQLVFLEPESVHTSSGYFAQYWYRHIPRVKRFNPVVTVGDKSFLVSQVSTPEGLIYSVGQPGQYDSAEIKGSDYSQLVALSNAAPRPLGLGTIKSYLKCEASSIYMHAILQAGHIGEPAKLYEITHKGFVTFDMATHIDPKEPLPHLGPDNFSPSDECKPIMTPYMNGLVTTYSPLSGHNCDKGAIQGRLEAINRDDRVPNEHLLTHMEQFVKQMGWHEAQIMPVTVDEVKLRQARPTQRAILDDAELAGPNQPLSIRSFVKAETYGKINDPRNISTYPSRIKLEYSTVMYAVSDWTKKQDLPFYAFGKTPLQLATLIHDKFQNSNWLIEIDASRQDGHINRAQRTFEAMRIRAMFMPSYKAYATGLHAKTFGLKGKTRYGYKYEQGYSRGSGSNDTSEFNSDNVRFIVYLAFRYCGMMPDQAFQLMSLCFLGGGDDGLIDPCLDVLKIDRDKFHEKLVKAATDMGQVLKITWVRQFKDDGEPTRSPVSFFARFYVPPMGPDSCADIGRALSKLSSTSDPKARDSTFNPIDKLE